MRRPTYTTRRGAQHASLSLAADLPGLVARFKRILTPHPMMVLEPAPGVCGSAVRLGLAALRRHHVGAGSQALGSSRGPQLLAVPQTGSSPRPTVRESSIRLEGRDHSSTSSSRLTRAFSLLTSSASRMRAPASLVMRPSKWSRTKRLPRGGARGLVQGLHSVHALDRLAGRLPRAHGGNTRRHAVARDAPLEDAGRASRQGGLGGVRYADHRKTSAATAKRLD